MTYALLARVLLRAIAAALVGLGWLSPDMAGILSGDPDLLALTEWAIAGGTFAITETWGFLARKYGWFK